MIVSWQVAFCGGGPERSFISQLECGLKQPSPVTIFQLAKALQTSPARIIDSVETLYNEP